MEVGMVDVFVGMVDLFVRAGLMTIEFLRQWQELTGSLIGASAPLLLWFVIGWVKERREFRGLDKTLNHHINAVLGVRLEIRLFAEDKLPKLITAIGNTGPTEYAASTLYLHLFAVPVLDEGTLRVNSGSSYFEQQIALLIRMSKNFQLSVDDVRRQLEGTVATNKEIAFRKLIPPSNANKQFKENLENFQRTIQIEFLELNVPNYIQQLVKAQVVLHEILRRGIFRWRRKVCPTSFRYFRNKNALVEFRSSTYDRIERALGHKVIEEVSRLERLFGEDRE
ncbi:hypothetical protein HY634_02825 [Candidatus Uhrbacteria bacterium]|nr:hypothetical protein [Candidatus Uhrbacteria bacterium]